MTTARFDFLIPDAAEGFAVEQKDKIIIKEVIEPSAKLEISRKLVLREMKHTMAEVAFEFNLDTEKGECVETLQERIRTGIPALSNAFSRLSLVISEATNFSIFGPIITMPTYDREKVEVVTTER